MLIFKEIPSELCGKAGRTGRRFDELRLRPEKLEQTPTGSDSS